MPVPDNFSSTEHFQDLVRKVYNREVREHFSDVTADDDITTNRGTLKRGCLHLEDDPIALTVGRMLLFDNEVRRIGQTPILGMPSENWNETWQYVPQIVLYFKQDRADIDVGYQAVDGIIRVRVRGETHETISMAKANTLAQAIKTEFATGQGYVWHKGRSLLVYRDKVKQYQLQLLCRSESDGRELVSKVLDIQNDSPDWGNAKLNDALEPTSTYPSNPGTERILGETYKKVRRRPVADVRFHYALLHVWGTAHPLVLVDKSGRFRNALVA
jgi:hypothetical protein